MGLRRRISDMEDENDTLNSQLAKMTSARSGKYFQVGMENLHPENPNNHLSKPRKTQRT